MHNPGECCALNREQAHSYNGPLSSLTTLWERVHA